jgi:hypothetical protein
MEFHEDEGRGGAAWPQFSLPIENELLKLKLKASFGGEVITNPGLDPRLEHAFLCRVLAYEEGRLQQEPVTVYEVLGRPAYMPTLFLSGEALEEELGRLLVAMEAAGILLSMRCGLPSAELHRFLTEEFFNLPIEKEVPAGVLRLYSYEDFHPDPMADVAELVAAFLDAWGRRALSECLDLVLPEGRSPRGGEAITRQLLRSLSQYQEISGLLYRMDEVCLPTGAAGEGWACGSLEYTATTETEGRINYRGPFRLWLQKEGGWRISGMELPGFS